MFFKNTSKIRMCTHNHSFKIIITWTSGNYHHRSQKTEHCLQPRTFHVPSVIKPSPSTLDFTDKNVFYLYIPNQYCSGLDILKFSKNWNILYILLKVLFFPKLHLSNSSTLLPIALVYFYCSMERILW